MDLASPSQATGIGRSEGDASSSASSVHFHGGIVVSVALMEGCARVVEARAGLNFPQDRWSSLFRGLKTAAEDLDCTTEECARRVIAFNPEAVQTLIGRLTVGETYFFRERHTFDFFEKQVMPELIRARRTTGRQLRIWSAGCCTGEEPYSIAMAIARLLPDFASWDINILATDLNPRFLEKAGAACYGRWSFRGGSAELQRHFFAPKGNDLFQVVPQIRKLVTFGVLNLVEDIYPSPLTQTNAMDVIFCRNVLMYFSAARARIVAENLRRSLVDGGWLFPGAAEASRELFYPLTAIEAPGTIAYRNTAPAEDEVVSGFLRNEENEIAVEGTSQQDPQAPSFLLKHARQLASEGHLPEALDVCDDVLNRDKLLPSSHYLRGLILEELGKHDCAMKALRRALYLDPTLVLAHFALGKVRLRAGLEAQAKCSFENVRTLLRDCDPAGVLEGSDGLTAGRLLEIVEEVQ